MAPLYPQIATPAKTNKARIKIEKHYLSEIVREFVHFCFNFDP